MPQGTLSHKPPHTLNQHPLPLPAPCPAFAHSVRSGTGISLSQKAAGFLATCLTPVKLGADKPKAKIAVPEVRVVVVPVRGTQVLG